MFVWKIDRKKGYEDRVDPFLMSAIRGRGIDIEVGHDGYHVHGLYPQELFYVMRVAKTLGYTTPGSVVSIVLSPIDHNMHVL